MSGSDFNAQKARTKYALPLWVDAFVRDTLDLDAAEIGAFNLILWAMWTRETCELLDDDRKLARIARVTAQTWKRRIRPTIEPFFEVENGVWISRRLRREAVKTEKFLKAQSDRKRPGDQKNSPTARHGGAELENKKSQNFFGKSLENINTGQSGDLSGDQSGDHPTQETKRPSIDVVGGVVRARDGEPPEYREQLLIACGVDPVSGLTGNGGAQIGKPAEMIEANRWLSDLGLTQAEVLAEVSRLVSSKRDGPPSSLKYFTKPLQALAANLSEARSKPMRPAELKTISGGKNGKSGKHARDDSAKREAIGRVRSGKVTLGADDCDPWAGGQGGD